MGLRIAPDEVRRWEKAGLIPPATPPTRRPPPATGHHHHEDDAAPPNWRVTLTLTGLTLVSRSNAREHWSTRHRRDQREAEALRRAWHTAGLSGWAVPLPVAVTLTRIGGKPMDGDNLQSSLKAIRDAVAALIAIDDGDERITWRYRQRSGPGSPSVIVTVRPRRQAVSN